MTLTLEEIQEVTDQMDKEAKAIKTELYKMAWYMRGALSIEEAYNLDQNDREIIAGIIKENLEITKESKMPFF